MKCQTLIVLWFAVVTLSAANEDYENKLTKLWSLSSASNSDGSSVVNVTSASIVIQPSSYDASSRLPYARYAFKPRAIPLKVEQQVEKNAYYTQDDVKYKPHILFPGNFYSISKEKSNSTGGQQRQARFMPVTIPLIRNEEFQRRALDNSDDEEPIIEKPEGFVEQVASRRSLSDMLGVNDDDEDEEDELEEEFEVEDLEEGKKKNKKKKNKYKPHKIKKYMLPLLMAYKMKFFTLIPVMISGLVLLVGATGLAGFFFALFAAVMGLQKGGY